MSDHMFIIRDCYTLGRTEADRLYSEFDEQRLYALLMKHGAPIIESRILGVKVLSIKPGWKIISELSITVKHFEWRKL